MKEKYEQIYEMIYKISNSSEYVWQVKTLQTENSVMIANGFGVEKHPDGRIYIGKWKNGLFSTGFMKDKRGAIVKIFNNKKQRLINQTTDYKENKPYKLSIQKDNESLKIRIALKENGDFYIGEFDGKNSKGHFFNGSLIREEKGTLSVGFINGIKENNQCAIFHKKRTINYKNIQTKGTFKFANGDCYDGNYINGLREGDGILKFANGDVYEGGFKNDLREGEGILKFANGDVYEGGFKNDLREGEGILKFADGKVYKGRFNNGRFVNNKVLNAITEQKDKQNTI